MIVILAAAAVAVNPSFLPRALSSSAKRFATVVAVSPSVARVEELHL